MDASHRRKRGRPPQYVLDRAGKPVVGLSQEARSGRYYLTGSDPRTYLGSDFDLAYARFLAQADRQVVLLDAVEPELAAIAPTEPEQFERFAEDVLRSGLAPETPWRSTVASIPEQAFWSEVRRRIIDKPELAADRTGIPQIAWLERLRPLEPSLSLREAIDAYVNRPRARTRQWIRKQRIFWGEFESSVGGEGVTLRSLTADGIRAYHDRLWTTYNSKQLRPTFLLHRFQCIRSVLRSCLKLQRDVEHVRRVLDLTSIFELPRRQGVDPKPISPEQFRALLQAADAKMRAVLLLGLNCGLYPSEVAAIRKCELNLAKGTFAAQRRKTGIARVAILWPRTVEAVRAHMDSAPNTAETLFLNAVGRPHDAQQLQRAFLAVRRAAGLDGAVKFSGLRDACSTAAAADGIDINATKFLIGHRVPGTVDAYVKRMPEAVRSVCQAVERAFFG